MEFYLPLFLCVDCKAKVIPNRRFRLQEDSFMTRCSFRSSPQGSINQFLKL